MACKAQHLQKQFTEKVWPFTEKVCWPLVYTSSYVIDKLLKRQVFKRYLLVYTDLNNPYPPFRPYFFYPLCAICHNLAVHGVAESWAQLNDFTFTFHFHALEKEMAAHSSVLAWRIPGMGEPGGLPSMGSHGVGHDWSDLAAAAAYYTFCLFQ